MRFGAVGLILALAASVARAAAAESLFPSPSVSCRACPSAITYLAIDKGYLARGRHRRHDRDHRLRRQGDPVPRQQPHAGGRGRRLAGGLFQCRWCRACRSCWRSMRGSSPLYHDFLMRPDLKDEIKTVADLKGRTRRARVARLGRVYELGKVLETAGLTLERRRHQIRALHRRWARRFANGAVDAALEVPPFGALVIEQGARGALDRSRRLHPADADVDRRLSSSIPTGRASITTSRASSSSRWPRRARILPGLSPRPQPRRSDRRADQVQGDERPRPDRPDAVAGARSRRPLQLREPHRRAELVLQPARASIKKAPDDRLVDESYADEAAEGAGSVQADQQGSPLAGCR